VIWNGSQWVDYIFNSSDMSGGIGSVYIKVLPTHTVIYDPERKEKRVSAESWIAEYYDEFTHKWKVDNSINNKVSYLVNSSGVYFKRKSTLYSNSILEVWYGLRKGSKLKISVILTPAVTGNYRIVWKLTGIAAIKAKWAMATESIQNMPCKISDKNCSSIQFIDGNNTVKSIINWSDAYWFNKTTGKWETSFQTLELRADTWNNSFQAKIFFGNFTLSKGESICLDPTVVTFNSEAEVDGYISKFGTSYPPTFKINSYSDEELMAVGQLRVYVGGGAYYYYQYRSYVSFDTSTIPSMAYNLSVRLKLKTAGDHSNNDFTIKVMGAHSWSEQPIYGESLDEEDWGSGTTQITSWSTINYPGDDVYISLWISPDQINKVGRTQFELKSNREGIEPTGLEYVFFYSGDSAGNEPKLEVTYYIDVVNINGRNWYYRNVSNDKAVIVLFGGYASSSSVRIRSIDWLGYPPNDPPEKTKPKIEFLNDLLANGFSVLTNKDHGIYYDGDENWVKDAAMWLISNRSYDHVFLFGFSGGGVVVAKEIQRDYASTLFSAAVIAAAPVDWDNHSGIYQSADTASLAKVATSFIAPETDPSYIQPQTLVEMKVYYNNMLVHKEWHNFTGCHDIFPPQYCKDHGENAQTVCINWFNAAHPPNTPHIPSGDTSGYTGISYSYTTSTIDPNGDDVCYQFDWGDGSTTTTGYYSSGSTVSVSHTWESSGTYYVKVRAKDIYGAWSSWSENLTVTISSSTGGGGGGGCPTLFSWNGTAFTKEALLDIHASQDVTVDYTLKHLTPIGRLCMLQLRELDNFTSHIDYVKLYVVDSEGNWHECNLILAWHSQLGLVTTELFHDDNVRVDLTPQQKIQLIFLTPSDIDDIQSFVFELNGYNIKLLK